MAGEDRGLVEGLKQKLYKRGTFKADVSRSDFSLPREQVEPNWQGKINEEEMSKGLLNPKFLKKFFIFALAFFVLALGASAYIILSGSNIVSTENLEVNLKGPSSIKGGEELNLGITISNNNTTPIEFVDLVVTFPAGTREAGNLEKEMTRFRKNLGTLKQGMVTNESIKAVLFGEALAHQEIKVAVEYRTAGSNVIFEKIKTYDVQISTSPINLTLSTPEEVNVGNQIELSVDVRAQAQNTLANVLVRMDYPAGFKFKQASPKPAFGNNIWNLGALKDEVPRHIKIIGILEGQDAEKKLFRATAGTATAGKETVIGVPYGSTNALVLMRRSFVDLTATLSGESTSEVTTDPAQTIRGSVNWTNNLPDKLLNAEITVHFSGNALDQARVSPGSGAYRSTDDTIVWTRQHYDSLAVIEPGSSSQVNYDFSILDSSRLSSLGIRNPSVKADITLTATRIVDGGQGQEVRATLSKLVRVNSYLDFSTEALYSIGPFANSGPMPPRPNQETTYTVKWSVVNTANDLDGVLVRGTLPSHARFLGNISPSGTDLRYDVTTGIVTWNIGRMEAVPGATPVREALFQIALLPSQPQVSQTIPIMTGMSVSGRDLFTGAKLSDNVPLVDTRIFTDPNFKEDWAKVSN